MKYKIDSHASNKITFYQKKHKEIYHLMRKKKGKPEKKEKKSDKIIMMHCESVDGNGNDITIRNETMSRGFLNGL